jgi:hypothetical protein
VRCGAPRRYCRDQESRHRSLGRTKADSAGDTDFSPSPTADLVTAGTQRLVLRRAVMRVSGSDYLTSPPRASGNHHCLRALRPSIGLRAATGASARLSFVPVTDAAPWGRLVGMDALASSGEAVRLPPGAGVHQASPAPQCGSIGGLFPGCLTVKTQPIGPLVRRTSRAGPRRARQTRRCSRVFPSCAATG